MKSLNSYPYVLICMMSQLSKLMKQLNISRVQYDFSMKILKLCLKDYIFRCDFLAEVAFITADQMQDLGEHLKKTTTL